MRPPVLHWLVERSIGLPSFATVLGLNIMAAPRKSLAEYLQWAALKPRTNGWSALVAYDRKKCNQLLLQQYIEKYDQHSVLPPVSGTYGTSESSWHWLRDCVTDAPRMSFENNPDGQTAEVNLSMAVIGGTHISLNDADGFARVNKISVFDPLDHPTLKAERVELKDIQGCVTRDGEVLLDLGDPGSRSRHWELDGDRLEHERLAAGAFFKRQWREADLARRTFSLGSLAQTCQAFMKPVSFKLRSIMEEGAASRGAANFGNGAIEMRIAMDDEPPGGAPGEDWVYPMPSDRPDLDALTVLGSHFFMHGIIGKGTARAFNVPAAQFDSRTDEKGFVQWLGARQVSGGYLEVPPLERWVGGRKLTFLDFKLPIYIDQDDRLTMTLYRGPDGASRVEVGVGGTKPANAIMCKVYGIRYRCLLGFGLNAIYNFSLDPTSRRLAVTLKSFNAYVNFKPHSLLPLDVAAYVGSSAFSTLLGNLVAGKVMEIFNGLDEFDVFTLHTLYFNAENAVHLKTVDLTGEMILFGAISPRLTTFTINPLHVMLSHGQTRQLVTVPQMPGVHWHVESPDGGTEGIGFINESTGLYTAPPLTDIQGSYKRVKVIATGIGTDGHVAKALITVIARTLTLNPLIETCQCSLESAEETRELSAHATSGALRWRVKGDGRINETGDEQGRNTYHAPMKRAPGLPTFTVDEVIVENTANGENRSCLMVVNHHGQLLAIKSEWDSALPHQARLVATISGRPLTQPLTWNCTPAQAGSIDSATGVFTENEHAHLHGVVITALIELAGMVVDGFIVLALPLAHLPPKPSPESLPAYSKGGRSACSYAACTDKLPVH